MSLHCLMISVASLTLAGCVYLPFFPGSWDPLALPIAAAGQLLVLAGILLTPISIPWAIYEAACSGMGNSSGATTRTPGRCWFAWFALIWGTALITVCSLIVLAGISRTLGGVMLLSWGLGLRWIWPVMRGMRGSETASFPLVPLYLASIPVIVLLAQVFLMQPVSRWSRSLVVANAERFIDDIERYRQRQGAYPISLVAQWKDYHPGVLGIEKYHYHRHGDAYSLSFEQPKLLIDQPGTREWVVFNPRAQQQMYSHTSFFLLLSPEEHERSPGWYAVRDAGVSNWKVFSFD